VPEPCAPNTKNVDNAVGVELHIPEGGATFTGTVTRVLIDIIRSAFDDLAARGRVAMALQ
jgi:hypothetical protein